MDSLQDVHDALKGQSSQRVREKSDVEAGMRLVELEGATDLEADTLGRSHWQHVPGFGDRLSARIDRKDRACSRGIAESEPAVAAADLENTRAVETPPALEEPPSRLLDRSRASGISTGCPSPGPRLADFSLYARSIAVKDPTLKLPSDPAAY